MISALGRSGRKSERSVRGWRDGAVSNVFAVQNENLGSDSQQERKQAVCDGLSPESHRWVSSVASTAEEVSARFSEKPCSESKGESG